MIVKVISDDQQFQLVLEDLFFGHFESYILSSFWTNAPWRFNNSLSSLQRLFRLGL